MLSPLQLKKAIAEAKPTPSGRITIQGKRYRKCEVCHEYKKENFITQRSNHVVCTKCINSPKRLRASLIEAQKAHGLIYVKPAYIRPSDFKVLLSLYKSRGYDYLQIKDRIKNLRTQLAASREIYKLQHKEQRAVKQITKFKDSFAELTAKKVKEQ